MFVWKTRLQLYVCFLSKLTAEHSCTHSVPTRSSAWRHDKRELLIIVINTADIPEGFLFKHNWSNAAVKWRSLFSYSRKVSRPLLFGHFNGNWYRFYIWLICGTSESDRRWLMTQKGLTHCHRESAVRYVTIGRLTLTCCFFPLIRSSMER